MPVCIVTRMGFCTSACEGLSAAYLSSCDWRATWCFAGAGMATWEIHLCNNMFKFTVSFCGDCGRFWDVLPDEEILLQSSL